MFVKDLDPVARVITDDDLVVVGDCHHLWSMDHSLFSTSPSKGSDELSFFVEDQDSVPGVVTEDEVAREGVDGHVGHPMQSTS